jgi:hypothetical protein
MASKKVTGWTEDVIRNLAIAKKYESGKIKLNEHLRVVGFELLCRHGHKIWQESLSGPFSGKLTCLECSEARRKRDSGKHSLMKIQEPT